MLEFEEVLIRDLASFIGLIIKAFYAVLEAPLHYRCLEKQKIQGLGKDKNYDRKIVLDRESILEINWWIVNIRVKNGKRIRPEKVKFSCQTDASLSGWSIFDQDSEKYINGRWSVDEAKNQINYLELFAIFLGLTSLYKDVNNAHIKVFSDNVSAVAYINDMGGMASPKLNQLAYDIWIWCLSRNIYLSASYLKGTDNAKADFYSRNFNGSSEWMLKKDVFHRICREYFTPDIDLFASRINAQVDKFVTFLPSPGSYRTDAFSFDWSGFKPYLFPPFGLIGKVINKLVEDQVQSAVLILPLWRSQFWFPLVIDLLISIPVRLPRHRDLMCLPHDGTIHPLGKNITMVAVLLSADIYKNKVFIEMLQKSSYNRGKKVRPNNTPWLGSDGYFGAKGEVKIPLKRLRLQ